MFLFFIVGILFADDSGIQYEKRTEIDFEGLDILGEMIKPQGSIIMERSNAKFNPLIELRINWDLEMVQSVEMIK